MSEDHPRTPLIPPQWMPIGDAPELCAVGQWWDVIRVPESMGNRITEILDAEGEVVGPVILGDEGSAPRMCFLTPTGTAAAWQEPGTVPLGSRCHLVLPPVTALSPPGLHWRVLPARPRLLTHPAALARAIGRARRELRGAAETGRA